MKKRKSKFQIKAVKEEKKFMRGVRRRIKRHQSKVMIVDA